MSQGTAGKAKGIDPFYVNTAPDLTVATYFTSKQYAEENPDVMKRFVTAMEQSLEYAQNNPDAVRDILTEYTEIPPEAAAEHQAAAVAQGPDAADDRAALTAQPRVRTHRGGAGPQRADRRLTSAGRPAP